MCTHHHLKITIISIFLAFFSFANATVLPDQELNNLAQYATKFRSHAIGYPSNQNINLNEFYDWYIKSGLHHVTLNNAGDPFNPRGKMNALTIERKVIEFFAPLYGFKKENAWGLVTMSGTDGNNHGIYFGTRVLKSQSKLKPIVYVSKESHYSNMRLADVQNLDLRLIDTDEMGRMRPGALKKALNPKRPALVVFSIGTTFKGAIDDQNALNAVIDQVKPPAVYRHVDAALFGGFLPYTDQKDLVNASKNHFDSIAISGHKFFGIDEPCGLFITTKETLQKQKPFNVHYLNGAMPMISCSRSALNPLKFYWIIHQVGKESFTTQAHQLLESATYLKEQLDTIQWPAWLGPHSNTVFFKRPSKIILQKYHLATDYDQRFGGDLAHIVVMQHVNKAIVDQFIEDLKQSH